MFSKYSTDACAFIDIIYNLHISRNLSRYQKWCSVMESYRINTYFHDIHCRYCRQTLSIGTDSSLDVDEYLRNSPTIADEALA